MNVVTTDFITNKQQLILRRISIIAALITIFTSMMGLLSYIPGQRVLGSVRENYIPMAPSTSISFIILGTIILSPPKIKRLRIPRSINYYLAFLVSLFGLLELVGFIVDKDLNFEHTIISVDEKLGSIPIGRMSPSTGTIFFLAGLAVMGLVTTKSHHFRLGQISKKSGILGVITLFSSMIFLLAYAYGTPFLYDQGSTVPMAVTTAFAFLTLGMAILTSSGEHNIPLNYITNSRTEALLFRFFLPISILAVIFGSFMVTIATKLTEVNTAFIAAILVVLVSLVTSLAIHKVSTAVGREIDALEADRRSAERALQKSQKQILQSQKMEALGRLAGGIAHDFNNILTSIIGFGELIEHNLPDGDICKEYVTEILKASNRSSTLVNQLSTFSKKRNVNPKILNINFMIEDMVNMLGNIIGEDIELVLNLDENIENVVMDPSHFNQILLNLVVNSKEAMPSGGKINIITQYLENNDKMEFADYQPTGPLVQLSIIDTGIGIKPEVIHQIFEPFFTTKNLSTGIGLATIFGIIKTNNCHITVSSNENNGTCFQIYFPIVDEITLETINDEYDENNHQNMIQFDPSIKSYNVLLIEDDPHLMKFVEIVLTNFGIHVRSFNNPEQALQEYEMTEYDMIISDVIMPVMNGIELIEMMNKVKPIKNVLFMTGYIELPIYNTIKEKYNLIDKPFTQKKLLNKISSILSLSVH